MTRKFYFSNTGSPITATLALLLVMLVTAGTGFAQGTFIKGGTTMKIAAGTTVIETSNITLDNTGGTSTLTNDGTLAIKGNLVNNNTTDNSLGSGTISFEGTSAQTISGPNVFGTLKINNAAGVSFTGSYDSQVSTALDLTNGRLTLGSRNLLLLSGASVLGTPSATAMVVATGTGQLRKSWAANGSFTFPVGDATSTAEYSPVALNFTSGTYPGTNYIGVNLVNAAYNTSLYTGSYLNRYWVVTNNSGTPITGFTCDATFNYVDADIVGTEAELYCTKVAPDPISTYAAANTAGNSLSAAGLSTFSTFTGTRGGLVLAVSAWLEGPFNTTNNNMDVFLNPVVPLNQPYNVAPWNYAGTESVASIPADVVDWVLVSVRVAPDGASATAATQKGIIAALLKSDGTIVNTAGANINLYNVAVPAGQFLFPVVKHRNHLGVMSNTGATLSSNIYSYDFRNASNKVYPGDGTGHKLLKAGMYGLYTGDANGDGTIQSSDKVLWVANFNQVGYLVGGADFTLDGDVQSGDKVKWVANFNVDSTIP
jgi:hypothetical protein